MADAVTEPMLERPVIFANVAYDPGTWLELPNYWGPEGWASPVDWAAEAARYLWLDLKPEPESVARTETILTQFAENYGGSDPDIPFEVVGYLHLPHPAMLPLYLRVWVDDSPGLTVAEAAQADDPNAVEPPVVEEFQTEHLGAGLRVLLYHSFELEADGGPARPDGLYASVRYAFAVPGHDEVLTVFALDPDLGRLIQAQEDIDEFVRQIHWAYEVHDLAGAP